MRLTQEAFDSLAPEEQETIKEVRPWDLIMPGTPRAHPDVRKDRYDICKGCERFSKITKSCKECGCVMALKTVLADAQCPLGKWGRVSQPELLMSEDE